jgi:hypothetical protein
MPSSDPSQPASTSNPLKCLHKGCGHTYTDPAETCIYHPGPPEFHEGQKGWLCCKPRVLTFDEFLAIEGCTRGRHDASSDGTEAWRKENGKEEMKEEVVMPKEKVPEEEVRKVRPIAVSERTVAGSLASAMQSVGTPRSTTPQPPVLEEDSDEDGVEGTLVEGMSCKRRGCDQTFSKKVGRKEEKCVYHPGVPLFHEGSKGWTCCKRKVLEFEEFLKIEGCKERTGHCYVGKKAKEKEKEQGGEELKDEDVRSDFYQTATAVIASFYLKKIVKDKAQVDFVDSRTVKLDLPTSDGKRYRSDVQVWGEIDPAACKSRILGTKLEVTLAKGGDASTGWPVLRATDRDTGERIQVGRAGRA